MIDGSVIGPDGEWTAYRLNTWDDSEPYPGFGALVVDARGDFEDARDEAARPVHPGRVEEDPAD